MSTRFPEFTSISPAVLRPRLPRIGNIKIGTLGEERTGKKGGKYRLPTKLDHFQVTTRAKDQNDRFIIDASIHKTIGPKPVELDVVLMFQEPQHNWQASFVAYNGKQLRCQGNGERAYDRVLGREIPCTCPLLKHHQGGYPSDIARPVGQVACKPYGVLSVLLPHAETYGGFYVFRTTSWETIASITGTLQMLYQQFGGLSFLPLRMKLIPSTDTYEEGGQTKTSKSFKVGLVLAGGIDTAFQLAAGAQEQRAKLLQLSAGSTYTPEEHVEQLQEIAREEESSVAEEFYPAQATDGVVDGEYEIEEDEVDPLETLIRRACQIAGADPVKTNNAIELWRDREGLVALAERVQQDLSDRGKGDSWAQAKAKLEAEANEEEPVHDEGDELAVETAGPESMELFS